MVSYLFIYDSSTVKKYPYYEIRQSYTSSYTEKLVEVFTIKTQVVKVFREKTEYDYDPSKYEKVMYGRSISNFIYDSIESYLMSEYDEAQAHIDSYEHIDLMINKKYKK